MRPAMSDVAVILAFGALLAAPGLAGYDAA
jgi:hypothetical protein